MNRGPPPVSDGVPPGTVITIFTCSAAWRRPFSGAYLCSGPKPVCRMIGQQHPYCDGVPGI
jgi:hypothetical protein